MRVVSRELSIFKTETHELPLGGRFIEIVFSLPIAVGLPVTQQPPHKSRRPPGLLRVCDTIAPGSSDSLAFSTREST